MRDNVVPGSFRDPSGVVFVHDGTLYRQVNRCYADAFDQLTESGLYAALVKKGLLVPHQEVDAPLPAPPEAYKFIRPERLPYISYPYEWCFSQLKDAALATLSIQEAALAHGMVLKDASAYNIQFKDNRPVFIDTLSFETYREGEPWVAYRQFCQHFLAPLALMACRDVRLSSLLQKHIDGVPLDLASQLLPRRTYGRMSMLTHIHLHARSQQHFEGKQVSTKGRKVSRLALRGIVDGLRSAVQRLEWKKAKTTWSDYYAETNYSESAFSRKKDIVSGFIERVKPQSVWDLGANTGFFSRLASEQGIETIAMDFDPLAVEYNYKRARDCKERRLLPLVMDLSNPSPAIGWLGRERDSFFDRGPADLVFALALVHHLAIGNNVPLYMVSEFFSRVARHLVIEFVPKEDSQVQRMLSTREDIFSDYEESRFEEAFQNHFEIISSEPVEGSLRRIYLMRRR